MRSSEARTRCEDAELAKRETLDTKPAYYSTVRLHAPLTTTIMYSISYTSHQQN